MKSSDKLLDKMKSDNIKPIPRWRHLMTKSLIWSVFAISIAIGALAFSIILFVIQQVDFDLVSHMSHSGFELLLALTPFLWIISLVLFLIIAIISIKHSKKGYKLSYSNWIGISTALSILTGTLFFISGGAGWLENAFSVRVSSYESVQAKKVQLWMMPEEGYLSGMITVVDQHTFKLRDFNDHQWTIDFQTANYPPIVVIEEGVMIKMIGNVISDNQFKAEEIRPWGGSGPMNRGKNRQRQ